MPCPACNQPAEGEEPRMPDGFKTEFDKTGGVTEPNTSEHGCLSGKTGNERRVVKVTRLTQTGLRAANLNMTDRPKQFLVPKTYAVGGMTSPQPMASRQ
jgi:hypothetical protein